MPTTSLKLKVQPGSDVLDRVVTVCRRRGLEILILSYADDEIKLTVHGEHERARRLGRWLDALIDVLDVAQPPHLHSRRSPERM
jgi:acetolactate synthase regulatory subunit